MTPDDPTRTAPPDATRTHDPSDAALDAGLVAAFGDTTQQRSAPADPQAGTVVGGKYRLTEPIGEGGMGSVWAATQTEPVKRKVAVKLIKAGMDSKAVLARFDAERQALAVMDHPHIAKVLDGGVHDGRPYFVMELVKGMPITRHCDERRLTPQQRLELFVPVCQAIQHAHQKGVIHRDIKPSNVLVALYDDKPVPKVIDFGVAKATGAALTEHTLETGFGAVVGTPAYMSPEQASLNNLDIDTRSDVYALGVLLYELLTGSPPFSGKELQKKGMLEMLRVVREEEPPRPSAKLSTADVLPTLSANRGTEPNKLTGLLRNELDWIVMKALEKDRTRRYETANGFAADVLRYLSGEAVQAHPPSTAYRLKKFVRRNKVQVTAGAAVFLAVLLGFAGTGAGLVQADEKRREAERARADEAEQRRLAEEARGREERQRVTVEYQLAGQFLDRAIERYQDPKASAQRGRLVRLAEAMADIPPSATAHRQFLARRVLLDAGNLSGPSASAFDVRQQAGSLLVEYDQPDDRPFVCQVSDHQTRKVLRRITHTGPVTAVEVTTDGSTLIVTTRHDATGEFVAYDLATAAIKWKCPYPTPEADHNRYYNSSGSGISSGFSPDGSRLIVTRETRLAAFGQVVRQTYRTELWDTMTAKKIGAFPGWAYHFLSTGDCGSDHFDVHRREADPAGGLKTVSERRALADGRLIASPVYVPGQLTPSGKCRVQFDSKEVRWVDPVDGRVLDTCQYEHVIDKEVTKYNWDVTALTDDWAVLSNSLFGNGVTVLAIREGRRAVTLQDEVVTGDRDGLLLASGRIYEFQSGRYLNPPADRQFHPDARRFAFNGRHIPHPDARVSPHGVANTIGGPAKEPITGTRFNADGWQVFDLTADRSLHQMNGMFANPPTPLGDIMPALDGSRLWADPAGGTLPDDAVHIDPADLRRFACLVELGDFDEAGVFRLWTTAVWAKKLDEFKREVRPTPGFPFADLIPNDHWAQVYPLDELADDQERLSVLNAIVKHHPSFGPAYRQRAEIHLSEGRTDDALRDFRTARERGVRLRPSQSEIPAFLRSPDLPRRTLDDLAEVFDLRQPAGERWWTRAEILLTYRRGEYRTALRELDRLSQAQNPLQQRPLEGLEQVCHLFAVAGTPTGPLSPLAYTPSTVRYGDGTDTRTKGDEALACLCLFHLGDKPAAKVRWQAAKKLKQPRVDDFLVAEVAAMLESK